MVDTNSVVNTLTGLAVVGLAAGLTLNIMDRALDTGKSGKSSKSGDSFLSFNEHPSAKKNNLYKI